VFSCARAIVMKFSPWTATAAVTLLLSAAAMAVATEDDICTGSKPFREVAQDEIYTMAELCRMREDSLREDREQAPIPIPPKFPLTSLPASTALLD
jgi:hypothetical protein